MLLLLFVLAAAVVPFVGLGSQSFWLDEFLSAQLAAEPFAVILTRADGEAPLYPLLLHGLVRAGLTSDWWLRFPSALAGALAVPALLIVGRQLDDRRVAIIAALLLAVHPFALWHAQEARAYALMMLAGLATTAAFLQLLRGRGGPSTVVGYGLASWIGIGVHYYFVFVLAAHGVVALLDAIERPRSRPRWIVVGLLTAAAVGLWLPLLASDFVGQEHVDGQVRFSWLALPYTLLTYTGGFSFGPPLRVLHPATRRHVSVWVVLQPYLAPTALAMALLAALLVLGLARPIDRRRLLVILLVAFPVLGPWICSAFGVGFRPRYTLPALPFVLLLVAGALRTRQRALAMVLLLVLGAVEVYATSQMVAAPYAREDARGAGAFVTAAKPDGLVIAVGEGAEAIQRYVAHPERVRLLLRPDAVDRAHLERFAASAGRADEDVFLVVSRPWTHDPNGVVQASLDRERPLREERVLAGTVVRWYGPAAGAGERRGP